MRIIQTALAYEHIFFKLKKPIVLVPTMGSLHQGHLSLVKKAQKYHGTVVVSIFVNPTQFGPKEDFKKYPRDQQRDLAMLKQAGADLVFLPEISEMYGANPKNDTRLLADEQLKNKLCGLSRPGHFDGVVTVVSKLFNIIHPQYAIFGKKDYQQFLIIRKMAADLKYPVNIIGGSLIREDDGLAMSSRNVFLSVAEREQARVLNQSLLLMGNKLKAGATIAQALSAGRKLFKNIPAARIDYLEVLNAQNLQNILEYKPRQTLIAMAVYIGKTRLIDNLIC